MRTLLCLTFMLFVSVAQAQVCTTCQTFNSYVTPTVQMQTPSAYIVPSTTMTTYSTEEVMVPTTTYTPTQVTTSTTTTTPSYYVTVTPAIDVECLAKIGREFLECTEGATTRRQRFRCALKVVVNNADCLFRQQSTAQKAQRVWFPRLKQRRQARQLVNSMPATMHSSSHGMH